MWAWDNPHLVSRRAIGAAAVFALHLLAIIALMHIVSQPVPIAQTVHELIFILTKPKPPETPKPEEQHAKKQETQPTLELSPTVPRSYSFPGEEERKDAQGLSGLGDTLAGCDARNLATMTPEQRRRCTQSALSAKRDETGVDYHDHTNRSNNAVRWARGRARKNGPALLPCANPNAPATAFLSIGTLICLGKGAIDGGFDLDGAPGYADKPEIQHLPNNGDPPPSPGGSAGPER